MLYSILANLLYMDNTKPRTTPKDFFLWAGAMVSLYVSVFSFLGLVFDYLNYAFPNPLLQSFYADPYQGSISYEIASLIVMFPLFFVLMRVILLFRERAFAWH